MSVGRTALIHGSPEVLFTFLLGNALPEVNWRILGTSSFLEKGGTCQVASISGRTRGTGRWSEQ